MALTLMLKIQIRVIGAETFIIKKAIRNIFTIEKEDASKGLPKVLMNGYVRIKTCNEPLKKD